MLRSTPEWEQFERDYIRNEPKGWHANIELFDDLIGWAEYLGALPKPDPLEGIEDDIRLIKALNARLPIHSPDGADRPDVQ
jgi:hypothetical protein